MSVYERRQYLSHLLNENNRKTEALEEQKEEINNKRKEKIACECDCILARMNMKDHLKTQKHIDLMKNKI